MDSRREIIVNNLEQHLEILQSMQELDDRFTGPYSDFQQILTFVQHMRDDSYTPTKADLETFLTLLKHHHGHVVNVAREELNQWQQEL